MGATRQKWGRDPLGAAADARAIAEATAVESERERKRKEEERERIARDHQVRKQRIRELLDPRERYAITHALRLAAEQFDADAKLAEGAKQASLSEQFKRQAKDSRDVLEWLED